jgi:HEAT repeat protein
VVSILLQHPEWLDAASLSRNFGSGSPLSRRVFTLLLGRAPETGDTRATLLRALRDDSPAVRWQAVLAIGGLSWDIAEKTPLLTGMLEDTNEFVGAIAAVTLGKIGATNAAPVLFTNLQERLHTHRPSATTLEEEMAPLRESFLMNFNAQSNPFDPGGLLARRFNGRMRRFGGDPRVEESFSIITALVEALGELDYQPATATIVDLLGGPDSTVAATALKKLAPAELTRRLVTIANDKNAQAQSRDEALVLLSDAPGANASDLVPLLDDHTIIPSIRPLPGREWRICDRAATTLAGLLGRTMRIAPMMPEVERDQQIDQVRQWLKAAY